MDPEKISVFLEKHASPAIGMYVRYPVLGSSGPARV
jgi:hypothetical protein